VSQLKQALQWVLNAKEGAYTYGLHEDFAPIGHMIITDMEQNDYVSISDTQLMTLTEKGKKKLEEA